MHKETWISSDDINQNQLQTFSCVTPVQTGQSLYLSPFHYCLKYSLIFQRTSGLQHIAQKTATCNEEPPAIPNRNPRRWDTVV